MAIFDMEGNLLETYDINLGWLEERTKMVVLYCHEDEDGKTVIDITDQSGTPIPEYDGHIPGGMPLGIHHVVDWKYYIYKPYSEEELHIRNIDKQTPIAIQMLVLQANLPDEQALEVEALYPEWVSTDHYSENDIRRYKDSLYRCINAHDAQESWTPDQAHSLWVRIRPEGEILEWEQVQPGINEPYKKGDRVTHNGKTWKSLIDNNVWEPGAVGSETLWKEVS